MSSFWLAEGTMMKCSFGLTPSPLTVLPVSMVFATGMPLATMMSNIPMLNIMTFGMCMTPTNPEVASIIASSLGTVDMAPCIPSTVVPWIPGNPMVMAGEPCINETSMLMCLWEGIIEPVVPSQASVMV